MWNKFFQRTSAVTNRLSGKISQHTIQKIVEDIPYLLRHNSDLNLGHEF